VPEGFVTVRFLPSGRSVSVLRGTDLLHAGLEAGLGIASSCSGYGVCAACLVVILEGLARLTPIDEVERAALVRRKARPDQRLACMARVRGDVTVTTTYW
jgi:adenylate cyclase